MDSQTDNKQLINTAVLPDQIIKSDAGKLRMDAVPTEIVWAIARVRTWALNNKYKDPLSYRKVETWRLVAATLRHFYKWLDDPNSVDEESGLNHLEHMATNIAFLLEQRKEKLNAEIERIENEALR